MSFESIPSEVIEAFTNHKCYKLLVKGAPGTGKTLLALSICAFLNNKAPAIYLSTRVTPENLYQTYPWVRKLVPVKYVLDATASRHKLSGDISVAFKYVDKPAFLQAVYELCNQEPKPIAIIVDSLEALKENLQISQEDLSLENSIIDLSQATETHIIFVSETEKATPTDYLVDGIIKQVEVRNDAFTRLTEIRKLRGIEIKNPSYLFSLQGGQYRVLAPQRFTLYYQISSEKNIKFEPIKNAEGRISTGSEYLDEVTEGGYFPGSVNLIEVQRELGESYDYFYLPTIFNQILNGGGVFIIPPSGIQAHAMKKMISQIISEEQIKNQVKIVDFKSIPGTQLEKVEKDEPWRIIIEGRDLSQEYQKILDALTVMMKEYEKILVLVGCDTLELVYQWQTGKTLDVVAGICRSVVEMKMAGVIVLCLAKYGQTRLIDYLNHICDNHFRVRNMKGTTIIHGIFPHFPAMYPQMKKGEKSFRVELIPIS